MDKRKVKSAKKESRKKGHGVLKDIKALHTSIDKSHDQLAKLYKKAMVSTHKDLSATKKLIAKAKQQVSKAKSVKAKKPKVHETAVSQLQSLQEKFAGLKTEMASLTGDFGQFNTQQKMSIKLARDASQKKPVTKKKMVKKQSKRLAETSDVNVPEVSPLLA